jgi:hypothetical protein
MALEGDAEDYRMRRYAWAFTAARCQASTIYSFSDPPRGWLHMRKQLVLVAEASQRANNETPESATNQGDRNFGHVISDFVNTTSQKMTAFTDATTKRNITPA